MFLFQNTQDNVINDYSKEEGPMTTVQQIRKRDGRVVPFHENKIADAINKAFQATYKPGYDDTASMMFVLVSCLVFVFWFF